MPRDTDTYADSLGPRVAVNFSHNSSATRAPFIQAIRDACAGANWTQTGTGTVNGFTYYDMLCVQSPWHDELATPPSDYVGKIKLRIQRNNDGSFASRIEIVARSEDETLIQSGFTTTFPIAATTQYRIVACPHQLVIQRLDGGADGNVIASALHTSRFQQEVSRYRECFWVSRNFGRTGVVSGTNTTCFALVKNRQGSFPINLGDFRAVNGTRLVQLMSATGNRTPRMINFVEDPTYANSALWYPFYVPPMFAWGDNPTNSLQIGSVKIRGWPWDCIAMVGSYPAAYKMTLPDGTVWEAYTVNGTDYSLFFRSA